MTRWRWAGVVIGLALLVAYTVVLREIFTSKHPGANDFFSRWAGAHLYLSRGWDPYGPEASLWIQNTIYGHPALPDQDASLFAYPFYTIFVVAPYALIPYDWAQAAWQVTLQVVLVATVILLLHYYRWLPDPVMLGGLVLWTLFFYPVARSLILGQLGMAVFLITLVAFWLMFRTEQPCRRCDVWAGILLAATTVKPHMQFLIIPFLLLWAARARRWHVCFGFFGGMALLLGASFALLPGWLGEWLSQIQQYPGYTPPAVMYIVTHEMLPLGGAATAVEWTLDALLLVYLMYEWRMVIHPLDLSRLDWVMGLTLVITHLVALRTATTHFIVFLFLLIPLFRDLLRHRAWGVWALIGLMLLLDVGMWWLFLATLR